MPSRLMQAREALCARNGPGRVYAIGVASALLVLVSLCGVRYALGYKDRNEGAAIGALKTIGTTQSLFREADKEGDGNLDYGTLAELGSTSPALIDAVLASGTKDGYVFQASYGATTSEFLWFATARPVNPGVTGDRYFATNHEGFTYFTTLAPYRLNTVNCLIPGVIIRGRCQ